MGSACSPRYLRTVAVVAGGRHGVGRSASAGSFFEVLLGTSQAPAKRLPTFGAVLLVRAMPWLASPLPGAEADWPGWKD